MPYARDRAHRSALDRALRQGPHRVQLPLVLKATGQVDKVIRWTCTVVWQGVAFAHSTCRLVAFGGTDAFHPASATTSLFNPATGAWTMIAGTKAGPGGRVHERLAYNPLTDRILMLGGIDYLLWKDPRTALLADLWSFNPSTKTWAEVSQSSQLRQLSRCSHAARPAVVECPQEAAFCLGLETKCRTSCTTTCGPTGPRGPS